ncbi:OmpA family protein [Escherichia coli]
MNCCRKVCVKGSGEVGIALKQTVLLWTLLLLLTTWLGFFAVSAVVKYAVVVILVAVTAAVMAYWHKKKGQVVADDVWPSSLPPETYRQPVVLVCGDMSAHLFTDSPVRQVSEGLYLPVSDEEQLVAQVERLLTLRPAWASQFAVAYTVMPGMYRDAAVLTGQLRRFAHSMATVRRRAGVNVPWLLWSGLSGSPLPERANSPWFICTGGEVQVATSAGTTMPAQWIAQSGAQERSQRLCYLLKAESLMQWLDLNVLAELNGPEAKCPPLAMTVGLVPSLPAVDNNLWQLWITARTGLTPDIADTGTDDALPFPDALLRRLPRQSGFTPLRRACVTMLGVTTVAGIAALCLSATANRQLLRQVGDDLHRFYAVPAEEFITKARHLSVLKDDAVMLDGYYREGEPLRLGLGLYPGERIRQPVLRAIRDWRPPEQKMDVTASLPVQTVRLDSMSLFDVGQARLKDGSTKVLVDALVNIRAKPGWLILVAGYTDATGDEKSNQQLSLRRAEAVRNWMLQTSDIPATCFAVQGLGESQPAATNDTPQGRAVNRRVEISLVPRSDACQDVK